MYLGNQPALSYTSFAKQDFTTSATTSYTLDHKVANENELALFINFVRQEAGTAYTASNNTLTLSSATSASDDMYAIFLGKAIQTVNPPNSSVGASQIVDGSIALGKLSASGTKDATTFLRGDNTFAVAGGTNTPAFFAFKDSSINVSDATFTIPVCNVETLDTDNGYNTSTGKYTIPTAGKYSVSFGVFGKADGNGRAERLIGRIVRERSGVSDLYIGYADADYRGNPGRGVAFSSTTCYEFNVGDVIYPQMYIDCNAGTSSIIGASDHYYTYIGAYKILT